MSARGEPYTECTLGVDRWDGDPPIDGAFLTTAGGSAYRIEEVIQRRSDREAATRGTVRALRCTRWPIDEIPADAMVYAWEWSDRRKRVPA